MKYKNDNRPMDYSVKKKNTLIWIKHCEYVGTNLFKDIFFINTARHSVGYCTNNIKKKRKIEKKYF